MTKSRVLSGMQPSGDSLHLGNYLGALVNWVKTQDEFDAFFFIPDMHAITVPQDAPVLMQHKREMLAALIAIGLDPEKSTIFYQSSVRVPERNRGGPTTTPLQS